MGLLVLISLGGQAQPGAFERTEQRQPCTHYAEHRQPLFGDLHVHSSYSFDSYGSGQRNDPWETYRYAKGEAISLPDADGKLTVVAKIDRPLDFTAVTDHGEFLGQISMCTEDAGRLGYWWPHCMMTRSDNYYLQVAATAWWGYIGVADTSAQKEKSFACTLSDCDQAESQVWNNITQAAEDHYDRSESCEFTTFIGYEYTDAPDANNLHRNVIFRNNKVIDSPVTTYETGSYNFPKLWRLLRERCIDGEEGCDVMSIPHNSNLSGGMMFPDPRNEQELKDRLFFEPVAELVQHKAASECRFDRLAGFGVGTKDELCDFEQMKTDNLSMLSSINGQYMAEEEDVSDVPVEQFASRNMLRNVLKDGLAIEQAQGENPFQMGFIGSTDTHSATPGGVSETDYVGHLGRRDAGYRNLQDGFFSNPGGLAVVWAEENSRDSIFAAIRRKETYATSGTRPIVRVFGGWDFDDVICQSGNVAEQGYQGGVPMGGKLFPDSDVGNSPRFVVNTLKDAGSSYNSGTDIQRVQMIKGWVDANGEKHERVYDLAGNPNNGAVVDPLSCAPSGAGLKNSCSVWQDPAFNPQQPAFYYVRVIENPTCRWSTLQCQAAGVNPFAKDCKQQAANKNAELLENGASGDIYGKCCLREEEESFYSPVIQERAWTSPIWYSPE